MKYVTIRMSVEDAHALYLLICTCGYPKNNHFDRGRGKCAWNPSCRGYRERARRGKIVKPVRSREDSTK